MEERVSISSLLKKLNVKE
jgi:hypothetical protein